MTQQQRPNVSDAVMATWDSYVNQSAQEFMDLSRQGNPDITPAQAAHDYAAQINEMFHSDSDDALSAEQIDEVETALWRYLDATQGTEWDIPADGAAAEALGLEDALAVSDYQGATAEGADDYIYHVSEEHDDETGQRYYLLQITHGAMPPHYSERFDSLSEMKQMRPLSEYPWLEWTPSGDAEV